MLNVGPAEWGILTVLGFFAAMTAWTIWWPRARYENTDPYLLRRGKVPGKGRRSLRAPAWRRPPLPEQGLAEAVAATLRLAPSLEDREILVMVNGQDVTLLGRVPSEAEKELASILARSVEGITHVRNELAITARESA